MASLALILCSILAAPFGHALSFAEERAYHRGSSLTDESLGRIAIRSDVDHFRNVLNTILIPRVVGTQNHERVKQSLVRYMEGLGWDVETDPFTDDTPKGRLQFENVVARLNPNARRYLVLACHYDSKYDREGSFLGATDSAVPCAMMINIAHTMKEHLNAVRDQSDLSLMFIFFDGEEAFRQWGPKDSIYGARHLAGKWSKALYPPNNRAGTSKLDQMDLLVLLDLLGAPNPSFYSFFSDTQKWYNHLSSAEKRLRRLGHITDRPQSGTLSSHPPIYFNEKSTYAGIEDDHIPFLRRGVPVLHIIPYPFPSVWHTDDDSISALDFDTIENLTKIIRTFVAVYLNLQI
ncbi:glutaminyl-peptide cyclotransferase-like [Ischnura elegans]|uniref:glutaminyl-peptide cyclotransferase-like n=1 Tax=Ischnura elegans TaxID=197161 RepID=UPI001ED87989|nr:glutaminyl-peptide cyclotransferase-like [Ischnura elegans]